MLLEASIDIMSTTVELSAYSKAIEAVKGMPSWLLASVALAALLLWFIPVFQAPLPQSVRDWLPLVFLLSTALTICRATNELGNHILMRRRVAAQRDRPKLLQLYRPLVSLFLTRHITATSRMSPPFSYRVQDAWTELTAHRRWNIKLKRALRKLFQREISTSAEIEYGGDFPLTQILALTRCCQQHVDTRLLNLVRWADRSRYENFGAGLTDEELALFEYIHSEHERLSRKLS